MYARAMGCDVVVLSSREDKRADARALGATEFHVLSQKGQSSAKSSLKINVLLLTGGSVSCLEWYCHLHSLRSFLLTILNSLMPLLAPRARIVPLVIQGEPLVIP